MIEKYYTVVFEGDGREMAKHLFQEIAPYGKVIGVCIGNEMEEADKLREAAAAALKETDNG